MWEPEDLNQFEEAVKGGALEERHDFDAKRQLPQNGKELAKDIAAMTTDGGVLVYGVGEDDNGQPRVLAPFKLAGAAERIDQVAQHSISGNPRIRFITLRREEDSAVGYLLAIIPVSPLAPHQVTVGGDRRFYGRCDTGNRRLSEEEVSRLYERRRRQVVDQEKLIAECILASPIGHPGPGEGFLQAFVQPAIKDDDLWVRAVDSFEDEEQLLKELRESINSIPSGGWGSNLGRLLNWRPRGADVRSLSSEFEVSDPESLDSDDRIRADLNMDGRCYFFYGGAATIREPYSGARVFLLFERGISVNLAQFLALVAAYYRAGGQWGPVDVGMAITGIQGASSAHFSQDVLHSPLPYAEPQAVRAKRYDARDLIEDPLAVSRELTDRLLRAVSDGVEWDPLED